MSEQSFWRSIQTNLKHLQEKHWSVIMHWQRFEDKFGHGIPDLDICIEGIELWIELKQVDKWPKRETTPVKIGLKKDQAEWLTQHANAGGRSFVMVKIGRDILIFNTCFGWLVNGMSKKDLLAISCVATVTIKSALEELFKTVEVLKDESN